MAVCWFKGGLGKRGSGVFEGGRGWYPNAHHEYPFHCFLLLVLVSPCLSVAIQLCMEWKKSLVGDSFNFVIQFCCKITLVSTLQQQKSSQKLVLEMPLTDEKNILHDHGIRVFLSCPFKGQNMYDVYLLCPFDLENLWPKWNHGTKN